MDEFPCGRINLWTEQQMNSANHERKHKLKTEQTNLRSPRCLRSSFHVVELKIQRGMLGFVAVLTPGGRSGGDTNISTFKLSFLSFFVSLNCSMRTDVCTYFQDFLHVFAHERSTDTLSLISYQLFLWRCLKAKQVSRWFTIYQNTPEAPGAKYSIKTEGLRFRINPLFVHTSDRPDAGGDMFSG